MSYVDGDIFVFLPPPQTLKTWEPPWDCMIILFEFQHLDVDEERSEWRLYWVAGLTLLRTVGHVLAKSDALASPRHQAEVDRLWESSSSNRRQSGIFWEFIEKNGTVSLRLTLLAHTSHVMSRATT